MKINVSIKVPTYNNALEIKYLFQYVDKIMTGIPDKENFDFKETINFPVFPQQNIKILVLFWGDLCISNIEYETHLDIYNRYTLYPRYWFAQKCQMPM